MELWPFAVIASIMLLVTCATVSYLFDTKSSLPNTLLLVDFAEDKKIVSQGIINRGCGPSVLHRDEMIKAYHIKFTIADAPDVVSEELTYMFNATQRRISKAFEREVFGDAGALPVITSTSPKFPGRGGYHLSRIGNRLSIDISFACKEDVAVDKFIMLFKDFVIDREGSAIVRVWEADTLMPTVEYIKMPQGVMRKVNVDACKSNDVERIA